jgi:hypothetical protein
MSPFSTPELSESNHVHRFVSSQSSSRRVERPEPMPGLTNRLMIGGLVPQFIEYLTAAVG